MRCRSWRGRRMKRSRERGRESWALRCALTDGSSMLPCSGSGPQTPRYSSRIQLSILLAVAPSGSPIPAETSAQSGLRLVAILRDDADHLSRVHGLARGDREVGDDPVAVRGDLVLHLHRLDDADDLARFDLVPVGDLDCEHRPLHRAGDGVARVAAMLAVLALLPAADELLVLRLGDEDAHLVAAAVQLDER